MTTKRILIIDDEPAILRIAQLGLRIGQGWNSQTTTSGMEGLSLAASEHPDAILLDVMMPEFDGFSILAQLQANPETAQIPVIFLTAKAQAADRRRFYEAGVAGVIIKPFDPTTLASQIAGFLAW
ncbi:MAG: response regulator [Synechococcaceae cyanobacterium SM2_3_1]|nr:response regulator [Synechococcaceae cyanobacterium SM2_3_1]